MAHKSLLVFLMLFIILVHSLHAQQVYEVDGTPGYNCWPMIQSVGKRIVCVFSWKKLNGFVR